MFVGDEVPLDVSVTAVQTRLVNLIRGGLLGGASQEAYSDGITGLARVGPTWAGATSRSCVPVATTR